MESRVGAISCMHLWLPHPPLKRDLGNGIRILVDESTFPEQKLSENLGALPVGGVESP